VATVALFQLLVFQKTPNQLGDLLVGLGLVVVGLSLFVTGLELGLFPLGEQMARDFARKGSVPWLVAFAFALGFGTTFAEPALIAISNKAAALMVEAQPLSPLIGNPDSGAVAGISSQDEPLSAGRAWYAFQLRLVVAVSVGTALVLGVFRILRGWPISYLIMGGLCSGHFADPPRPRQDHRGSLRCGRSDHFDNYGAAGYRPGCRLGQLHQGPKLAVGWIRLDCFCLADADYFCADHGDFWPMSP
jgi:hypothetical protein